MRNKATVQKKKSVYFQFGMIFLLGTVMLCGCGTKKTTVSEKSETADYLEQCESIKKYDGKYSMEQINLTYEEKAEYTAIKDNSCILGYAADLHLKCDVDITEEDIARIACEEMSVYIYNSEGEADIAECLVSVRTEGKQMQYMRLRFSDKTRSEYVVYLSEKAEGEPAYHIASGITEDMVFYTEISAGECDFALSGHAGKLAGISVKNEVTILKEMEDKELHEQLKKHIEVMQEIIKENQSEARIEYVFDVYFEGEKYTTVTMRTLDEELRDWGVVL